MEDHALAKAFPRLGRAIIRIVILKNNRPIAAGTGYVLGGLRKTHRAVVATAAHVLPFEDGRLLPNHHIRLEKYDADMTMFRCVTFATDPHTDPLGCHIVYDKAPGADVAMVIAPRYADAGDDFLDDADLQITPVLDRAVPAPATRIAWAGYPSLLMSHELFGKPHLCYYEGVVSSWVQHQGRGYVVVDGHAMPGVSGGPMWFFNDYARTVQVAGVVSLYAGYSTPEHFRPNFSDDRANQRRDRMPGFVFVQPIVDLVEHALQLGKTVTETSRPKMPPS